MEYINYHKIGLPHDHFIFITRIPILIKMVFMLKHAPVEIFSAYVISYSSYTNSLGLSISGGCKWRIYMFRMPLKLSVITRPHLGLAASHKKVFWSPQSTYIVKKSKMVIDIEIITDHFRKVVQLLVPPGIGTKFRSLVNIHVALTCKRMIRSDHSFSHATTTELSWHVQNCDLIKQ